jgi:hypothetical protein
VWHICGYNGDDISNADLIDREDEDLYEGGAYEDELFPVYEGDRYGKEVYGDEKAACEEVGGAHEGRTEGRTDNSPGRGRSKSNSVQRVSERDGIRPASLDGSVSSANNNSSSGRYSSRLEGTLGCAERYSSGFELDFLRRASSTTTDSSNGRANASTVSGAAGNVLQSELQKLLLQESRRQQLQSRLAMLREQGQRGQQGQQWQHQEHAQPNRSTSSPSTSNPTAIPHWRHDGGSPAGAPPNLHAGIAGMGGAGMGGAVSARLHPSSNRTVSSVRELRMAQLWSESQVRDPLLRPVSSSLHRQRGYDPLAVIGYFGSDQTPRPRPRRRRRRAET